MPSAEIRWLQRSAVGLALLAALTALLALPARHALGVLWPPRVQELVLSSGALLYLPAGETRPSKPLDQEVVASSFPHSLLALKSRDGAVRYGFAVDRDAETGLWWVEIDGVLQSVDEADLRDVWSPNATSVIGRVGIMRARLAERRMGQPIFAAATDRPEETSAESDDL